jgi:hypothetical protein
LETWIPSSQPSTSLPHFYCDTYINPINHDTLSNKFISSLLCPPCFPQLQKRLFFEHPLLHLCRLQTRLASGWQTLLLVMTTTNVSVAIVVIGIVYLVIITAQSPPQHSCLYCRSSSLSSLSCYHLDPISRSYRGCYHSRCLGIPHPQAISGTSRS